MWGKEEQDRPMLPIGWTSVIHSAGGVVWKPHQDSLLLMLIRRTRYGLEWTLPKGKLKAGEGWEDAAIRETQEETGCKVALLEFAGGQIYRVKGRPKVVLYWHMACLAEGGEVDPEEIAERRWVTSAEALQLLSYERERQMFETMLQEVPPERIRQLVELRIGGLK